MKKFLWILCTTFPIMAVAQTPDSANLFPELQQFKNTQQTGDTAVMPSQNNASPQAQAQPTVQPTQNQQFVQQKDSISGQATPPNTPYAAQTPSPYAAQNTPTNAPKKQGGVLRLLPDNLQIVTPPARGFAFCTGKLTLENQTGETVKSLSLKLRFGGVDIPVAYSSVPDKGSQTKNIGSAGASCQNFANAPMVTVVSCATDTTTTAAECQQKIRYIPID